MLNVRNDFPLLRNKPELCYLDSAATTQKPDCVIETVTNFLAHHNANVGRGIYRLVSEAENRYEEARERVAKFIGAKANEIIFTANTTSAINLVSRGFLRHGGPQEVYVTDMEHNSNLLPWLNSHCPVRFYYPCKGKLPFPNAALVALPHISNVIGEIYPVEHIAQQAQCPVLVDAAQSVGHLPVNVTELGCRFLAFSGHKLLALTGVGVLYIDRITQSQMGPVFLGGGTVDRFYNDTQYDWAPFPHAYEAGTPPIVEAISLATAIDYLDKLRMDRVTAHIAQLTAYCIQQLKTIGATVIGAGRKHGLVSFNLDRIHPHDVAFELDKLNIAVRAGHLCAHRCLQTRGLKGCVRASFHVYNTLDDVDRLIEGLTYVRQTFPRTEL